MQETSEKKVKPRENEKFPVLFLLLFCICFSRVRFANAFLVLFATFISQFN